MKVVINKCFGGFGLSKEVLYRSVQDNNSLIEKIEYGDNDFTSDWEKFIEDMDDTYKGYRTHSWYGPFLYDEENKVVYTFDDFPRDKQEFRSNPELIRLVEELGEEASGEYAELAIVEIPDDVEWEIHDYDGMESIHEKHRTWS